MSVRAQLAEIVSQLGDSVLDVGCGPGAMWPHFQRFRPRLTWQGVDSTAPMLSVARRLFPDVDAHHADASALPFDDASFDVVLLRHVLEHVPEWVMRAALKEATRVARSVVVVAFHVPASDAEPTHVSRVGEGFLQTRWSRTDVLAPIERAGWRVAERCSISDPTDARDAVWLLRPASRRKALPSLQTPKVSIVMPTLRRPHTIFRTIRSAASDANSPRRRGLPVAIVTISCTSSRSWRVTAGPRRRATS